jgi:mannose-6-phosphate isomerase class I
LIPCYSIYDIFVNRNIGYTKNNMNSNYNKFPSIPARGTCGVGWDCITETLRSEHQHIVVVECYPGVRDDELLPALIDGLKPTCVIKSADCLKRPEEIKALVQPDVTEDAIFGYLTQLNMEDYFARDKLASAQAQLLTSGLRTQDSGLTLVYGPGASLVSEDGLLVYADMPRWEAQLRFRRHEVGNLFMDNRNESPSHLYKQAFFVDWRVADRVKRKLLPRISYFLDTTLSASPKLASGDAVRATLQKTTQRPFRVVPFFDPAPWGGQWMKEVCDLNPTVPNYGWCFDCVPEENSLLLQFDNTTMEIPSINLVFSQPRELLGDAVYKRFGDEFPIRFDFLDTMGGGNLSLQVHPLTEYIQQTFGMPYTQDESYYMLDTGEGAHVYLGLREDVNPQAMLAELEAAQTTGRFDAATYAGVYPVKKHDHVLIPAGTLHCSGKSSMVLEISATPYIFTFKLWDWGRLGLDGKPRPINIGHGKKNIQWNRTESWVKANLINQVSVVATGDGWVEERTGLHELEFIETRRHWFTKPVPHHTGGGVNVLNLIEGREAIVESPTSAFEPFIVHYAETFIVPAVVGAYTISPFGESHGQRCGTIKATVRSFH